MRLLCVSCGVFLASEAYVPAGRFVARARPLGAKLGKKNTNGGIELGGKNSNGGVEINVDTDEFEIRLGELIFSTADPRMEVASAPGYYGEDFCEYVIDKAEASDDIEERVALKSLVDMVRDVQQKMEARIAEIKAEEAAGGSSSASASAAQEEEGPARKILNSAEEIFAAAKATVAADLGVSKRELTAEEQLVAAGPSEAGLRGEALVTYDALLKKLLAAQEKGVLKSEVELDFERCDFSLLQLASARRESDSERAAEYSGVLEAVNGLAARRLERAATVLGAVLRAGTPLKIMEKMTEIGAKGEIDVQLLELIEANRQQAQAAGTAGAGAAELMKNLANKCKDALDRKFNDIPEKKLLRALLRAETVDQRDSLLRRAFEPKEELQIGFDDDAKTAGGPEVEPPKFIAAAKQLIADFGNLDDNGQPLSVRILRICDEAERVALELFGECATPREQQDRMWTEATTSVFELEAAEMHAESQGDRAPWQNDAYDDMLPPGFDEAGVKRVGGG